MESSEEQRKREKYITKFYMCIIFSHQIKLYLHILSTKWFVMSSEKKVTIVNVATTLPNVSQYMMPVIPLI